MKVSIITATYNSEKNILSALKSVAGQTYSNLEWVVVDGGSTDHTVSLVKKNYNRELKIVSEKDNGIYDALNKGLQLASGDIVGFLHSDDLFASSTIVQEIAEQFDKKNINGVYGDLQYVKKENPEHIVRYWRSESFEPGLLKKGWMPAHPTLFLKRDIYEKYGNFNTGFSIAADYDFILRIFKNKKLQFLYLPKVFTLMRTGGASNRDLKNILRKSTEDWQALRANGLKFPLKILFFKNFSKLSQFLKKKK